jgi:hypothetical protein
MSQKTKILEHLKRYGSISTWQAISEYHVTRLGAHICQLKREGFPIVATRETDGKNWWANYKLVQDA